MRIRALRSRPRWPGACALLLAVAALLPGCVTRVETDFDPAFDFSGVSTWAWAPVAPPPAGTDPRLDNDLVHARVRHAIAAALVARGLREAEANADVAVAYHLGIERKLDIDSYGMHGPYGRYWSAGYQDIHVREYEVGTLLIDLYDPRSERLVWRGATQSLLHEGGTPEQRDARARSAASRVLAEFPPPR